MRTSMVTSGLAAAILIGASAISLAQDNSMDAEPASMVGYIASLSGASEVPPVETEATGMAELMFDTGSMALTWTVTYEGLTGPATAAHFHGPAGAGETAPPVIDLGSDLASPVEGSAILTDEQADMLASGQLYLNIHTEANPGGEIRGPVTLDTIEANQPRAE